MTYSPPITWSNDTFVTADKLNTALVTNMEALKNRPFTNVVMSAIAHTTSTSFVEVTGSSISLVLHGGNVFLAACGIWSNDTTGQSVYADISCDGVRYGDATVGLSQVTSPGPGYGDCMSLLHRTSTPPLAGSHTWALHWRVTASQGAMLARFFVIEL